MALAVTISVVRAIAVGTKFYTQLRIQQAAEISGLPYRQWSIG